MQNNFDYQALFKVALKAACEGGTAILEIYNRPSFITELKEDRSPLTEADLASNVVINQSLEQTELPIINEEIQNKAFTVRSGWALCWIVDPLDGTKEFIKKNGEFTVNIALCKMGNPIFGVIYVPVSRELYYGDVEKGKAYKTILDDNHELTGDLFEEQDRIYPSEKEGHTLRVVGSRSHMNKNTLEYLETVKEKYSNVEIVSKGSSLKFCLVADGKADVYPRFAPTMEWDTAAGHAICKAVGLKVTAQDTQEELKYNKENLLNPYFLVAP